MLKDQLISTNEFCRHYQVEYSFINSLREYGLIEITTVEQTGFINMSRLNDLEKYIRMHYDLDINLEGIEAINHLLEKLDSMQNEIIMLKNKLSAYQNKEVYESL